MKNKRIHKIIFYTILVLCISAFSYFPKSYSKYIKEEEPARFYVGISKLYMGDLDLLTPRTTSTYKIANYSIEFRRNDLMNGSDTQQQLFIEVEQAACTIDSISSKGSKTINGNNATITYTSKGEDYIIVNYSCNVSDIVIEENEEELVYTNVRIYEKYMPEDIKYLVAKADGVKMFLSEYYVRYPKPKAIISNDSRQLTLNIDTDNKYNEFNLWLNSYVNSVGSKYAEHVTAYINSVFNNESDILNLTKELKGLTVTYDEENQNYIYQLDDNFLGYARTYYIFEGPDDLIKVAFSNPNLTDAEINEIFKYYIETYGEYSSRDIDRIMEYVSSFGSVNYIMKPKQDGTYNEIKGLVYLVENDEIRLLPSLLDYVTIYIDKEIKIAFAEKVTMFNVFLNTIESTYDFITEDIISNINTNRDLYDSIGMNNINQDEKIEYSDYILVQDTITKKYILFNVYSDGDAYTYVKIIELGEAELIEITQVDNKLSISIKVNKQDIIEAKNNVIETVSALDEYFNVNYEEKIIDELFVSSVPNGDVTSIHDTNSVTVTYTITK